MRRRRLPEPFVFFIDECLGRHVVPDAPSAPTSRRSRTSGPRSLREPRGQDGRQPAGLGDRRHGPLLDGPGPLDPIDVVRVDVDRDDAAGCDPSRGPSWRRRRWARCLSWLLAPPCDDEESIFMQRAVGHGDSVPRRPERFAGDRGGARREPRPYSHDPAVHRWRIARRANARNVDRNPGEGLSVFRIRPL